MYLHLIDKDVDVFHCLYNIMKIKQGLREKISNYICVVMLIGYCIGGINEIREGNNSNNSVVIGRDLHK